MNKFLVGVGIVFLSLMTFINAWNLKTSSIIEQAQRPTIVHVDHRVDALNHYMDEHKFAKPYNTDDYIRSADQNHIDFRILPVITELESSGCRAYPRNTNNCWGYGSSTGLYKFKTESEGIAFISEQLSTGRYYAGKSLERKIKTYNSVNPQYWSNFTKLYNEIK